MLECLRCYLIAGLEERQLLYDVFELTHVAGPAVMAHYIVGLG